MVGFALLLNLLFGFPRPQSDVAKGASEDLAFALVLYVCMLLGMASQHLYARLEQPKRRRPRFDWGVFLAPAFASPIVFLPLLISFQNAGMDLSQLTVPRIMIFIVAFQNGFFWKAHFDRRRKEVESGTV
jgi:hypothetical protein